MPKPPELSPLEQVALFRSEIIGALLHRDLSRGQLQQELRSLSQQRFRPPGAACTRTFSVPTLERWLYAYKRKGLAALSPKPRSDRGRGRHLAPPLRALLLDIRQEHPHASVPLILRTLEGDGRLQKGQVSAPTLRRLYAEQGLRRGSDPAPSAGHTRLRWEAKGPDALWHADVCHGPTLQIAGAPHALRIHAILDDASRFLVQIAAFDTEREQDMLILLVRALRAYGRPEALYLDNGSTYTGQLLKTVCSRLGLTLLHAKPYDPQARGKMERFWRTLREGCLAFLPSTTTYSEVQRHLDAFVQQHYHSAPHASLLGKSPQQCYGDPQRPRLPCEEPALREALTVRERRRVRRDTTLSFQGQLYELDQGYLAGQLVTVATCLLDGTPTLPLVEHEGRTFRLHPCDPKRNAHRKRTPSGTLDKPLPRGVPFDPLAALAASSCTPLEVSHDDDDTLPF